MPFASAEEVASIPVAYCSHLGYDVKINEENKPTCDFGDGTLCTTDDFYNNLCGQNKIRESPLRQEGEYVYPEFEKCAEGLKPSKPQYALDQPKCYNPNRGILNTLWAIPAGLFLAIFTR